MKNNDRGPAFPDRCRFRTNWLGQEILQKYISYWYDSTHTGYCEEKSYKWMDADRDDADGIIRRLYGKEK